MRMASSRMSRARFEQRSEPQAPHCYGERAVALRSLLVSILSLGDHLGLELGGTADQSPGERGGEDSLEVTCYFQRGARIVRELAGALAKGNGA